jgi:hypothetical protein
MKTEKRKYAFVISAQNNRMNAKGEVKNLINLCATAW